MPIQPSACNPIAQPDFDAYFRTFSVTVDGKPVAFHKRTLAMKYGPAGIPVDVTAKLKQLGLTDATIEKQPTPLPPLSAANQQALVRGAYVIDDCPAWGVQDNYFWQQQFPAHSHVHIAHHYAPLLSESVNSPEYAAAIGRPYCAGAEELHDLQRATTTTEFRYILSTGANWAGPIRHFHLTLDKASPDQHLSVCWAAGHLNKTSPTRFEADLTNFTPAQELNVLLY